jgi:Inner membrane protein YgaP-like, transmembrane domain
MQATTQQPSAAPKTFLNEAAWDRGVRILLGVVLLYVGWSGGVAGAWGYVFRYLGFVPLLTGLVGWCPLYRALGISTCRT